VELPDAGGLETFTLNSGVEEYRCGKRQLEIVKGLSVEEREAIVASTARGSGRS